MLGGETAHCTLTVQSDISLPLPLLFTHSIFLLSLLPLFSSPSPLLSCDAVRSAGVLNHQHVSAVAQPVIWPSPPRTSVRPSPRRQRSAPHRRDARHSRHTPPKPLRHSAHSATLCPLRPSHSAHSATPPTTTPPHSAHSAHSAQATVQDVVGRSGGRCCGRRCCSQKKAFSAPMLEGRPTWGRRRGKFTVSALMQAAVKICQGGGGGGGGGASADDAPQPADAETVVQIGRLLQVPQMPAATGRHLHLDGCFDRLVTRRDRRESVRRADCWPQMAMAILGMLPADRP